MIDDQKNPYVGPRTFLKEEGHLFFGRDREARDLLSLVASEQLVLFYAQSGAGKSSLINTRLVPGLEAKKFQVFRVGRVGGDRPPGIEIQNIYVFNLMRSLIQQEIDPDVLAKLSLSEFLARLNANESGYFYSDIPLETRANPRRALIIDQFEELFSTHPEAWKKREEFFNQLAQAMENDPYLWIVLVMREEYIAQLDPYAYLLSNGLRVRYYMQRLSLEASINAVKKPAEKLRPYAADVAEKLVENLANIKAQKTGPKQEFQSGQYVEPVQLQVVCHSLWENLPPEGEQITEKDLHEVGDVDQSLERYYDQRVSAVAKQMETPERLIRKWFEEELITSSGTRNIVLQNVDSDTGLNDAVIQTLQGDLIRAEMRAGQIWYELSHDRLIEPVRTSNAKWFEQNLSFFQRQVLIWIQQGRSDSLLLRGEELQAAEREAEGLALTNDEQAFLNDCRVLRKHEQRDKNQRRVIFVGLIVSVILLIVAVSSWKSANQQKLIAKNAGQEAEASLVNVVFARATAQAAAKLANAGQYAALAETKAQNQFNLSLLLSMEAFRLMDNYQTRSALLDIAHSSPHLSKFLFGHNDSVTSVAFSPDGKRLASGSWDNTIILWDVAKGQSIGKPLEGHKSYVQSVAFSPDGKTLASGSDDDTIILWDLTTYKPIGQPLKGHSDSIYSIAFSPDGKTLASGSWDDSIILWDLATRQPIGKPLIGHTGDVYSVAFSPDGNTLASGSLDTTIILWDVATQTQKGKPLEANNSYVESLVFSPDGKILASAGFDNTITLWDVTTSQQLDRLRGHTNWIASLAFSPNNQSLASASADGSILLWDIATGQLIDRPLVGHSGVVNSVAFSPDGKTLASAGSDKAVVIWDVNARQSLSQSLTAHKAGINSLSFSPDGKTLASGSDDSNFILWDFSTLQPIGSPHSDVGNFVKAVAFSPDGKMVALGGYSIGIIFWNVADMEKSTLLLDVKDKNYDYVYSLAFSPDGKILASGNLEDTIVLWDVTARKPVDELKGPQTSNDGRFAVTSLAFSLDGKLLASASEDKTLILWDLTTSKKIGEPLTGHKGPVYSVAFSPDGLTLASASADGTIILWDVGTHQPLQQLAGHINAVQSVAFSPDGNLLASGSGDHTIILWDVKSGQPIGQPITGHSGPVYSLVFSPDGRKLVSASNEIIIWDLDPQAWVEKSCQRVGRNFTRAEWAQYFPSEEYRATCKQWPLEPEAIQTPIP